jgi:hypothetical protein
MTRLLAFTADSRPVPTAPAESPTVLTGDSAEETDASSDEGLFLSGERIDE